MEKKFNDLNEQYTKGKNSNSKTIQNLTNENNSFKKNSYSNEEQIKTKIEQLEEELLDKKSSMKRIKFCGTQKPNSSNNKETTTKGNSTKPTN